MAITLTSGWNLVNSPLQAETPSVASVLGTQLANTISIWKWEGNQWAVSLPNDLSGDDGEAYANSKNFSQLTELKAGEGFWLNLKEAGQLTLSGQYQAGTKVPLLAGWNLVGLKGQQGAKVDDIQADTGLQVVSI